jgi:hypothetical protein
LNVQCPFLSLFTQKARTGRDNLGGPDERAHTKVMITHTTAHTITIGSEESGILGSLQIYRHFFGNQKNCFFSLSAVVSFHFIF